MAPEQLEGKEADHRTDIWVLGCVLYEIATARPAFSGSSASVIAAILAKDPEPIQTWIRSLPDGRTVGQVSTHGGIEPRWCLACDELFFRKGRQWRAASLSFQPALRWDKPRVVFETDFVDTPGRSYEISPAGRYLYVVKPATVSERRKLHLVTGWLDELSGLAPASR